jgi:hypothetical protein
VLGELTRLPVAEERGGRGDGQAEERKERVKHRASEVTCVAARIYTRRRQQSFRRTLVYVHIET